MKSNENPQEKMLSTFPSYQDIMQMIHKRNRRTILMADMMSISEKRNCFLALRQENDVIKPSSVFFPIGITVGELALSQVLMTTEKQRKI